MIIFKNKEDYLYYINKKRIDGYLTYYDCDEPEKYPVIAIEFAEPDLYYKDMHLNLKYVTVDDAIELINIKNQQDYLERDLFAEKDWRI